MAEPKWTPGPWRIAQYVNYEGFSISAENAGCIAERWWPALAPDIPIKANANLIAAAPDLYDALARLMGELPSRRDWLDPVTEAMANAALAKARGEAVPRG